MRRSPNVAASAAQRRAARVASVSTLRRMSQRCPNLLSISTNENRAAGMGPPLRTWAQTEIPRPEFLPQGEYHPEGAAEEEVQEASWEVVAVVPAEEWEAVTAQVQARVRPTAGQPNPLQAAAGSKAPQTPRTSKTLAVPTRQQHWEETRRRRRLAGRTRLLTKPIVASWDRLLPQRHSPRIRVRLRTEP